MANGDFALVQVFDAERVAEGASQLFELEDFAGVRLLMNAMERFDAAVKKIRGDGAIGGEHEFFDEAVSNVAFAARDVGHALLFVEFDDRFGRSKSMEPRSLRRALRTRASSFMSRNRGESEA